MITSVLEMLGKFCKQSAAETQTTKVSQGNKTEIDFNYLKFGLMELNHEIVVFAYFMSVAAALVTHFRKYYPESLIRVSRYYWNRNEPILFWCILILREGSQNAVIFVSALPVLLGGFCGLGWFSLLWLMSFLKAMRRKVM